MVSPLPEIVTLEQAVTAARLPDVTTGDYEDDDRALRLEIAHELVLDYVNNRVDDADEWLETILAWDADNAPRAVKAAILAMFTYLCRFRGDDVEKEQKALQDAELPDHVRMFLKRLRDPTVS